MRDTEDQELQQVLERNERNTSYQKKLKSYYRGVYSLLAAWLLWALVLIALAGTKTGLIIGLIVFAVLFISWLVLCFSSPVLLRCPHCDASLYRADPLHIQNCPYCRTSLTVQQYYGREEI